MSSITELYSAIYGKLSSIQTRFENAESQLVTSQEQDEVIKQKRIDNLKCQLEKIEEYSEKVEYFRLMAEKKLKSKNLLAITPRELNFNRLRNWAMMIDPTQDDDPYAQRIYVQAKCNELFLTQKKQEFEKILAELTGDHAVIDEELEAAVQSLKSSLIEECKAVLESEEFIQLATLVMERHSQHIDNSSLQNALESESEPRAKIGLGIYAQSLPVLEEVKYVAKAKLGEYFDNRGYILLPVEYNLGKEMLISINCAAAKERKLYRGIQNLLANFISKTVIGTRKIYCLDALHFNNTVLGALRPLEDSIVLDAIPKDSEAVVDKLKEIVSTFSDIDEVLGLADSVQDYNLAVKPEERIDRSVLVLVGYPSAFSSEAKSYIKRILLNYEHYGITPILIDTQFQEKKDEDRKDVVFDIVENVYRIQMTQKRETIRQDTGTDHYFKWYERTSDLSISFVNAIRDHDTKANTIGNEYLKRYSLTDLPGYVREYKKIELPFGIDGKDEAHSLSFENENFATYLVGASRSGKSTLLHTLIAGLIRNYHPDNVELWLADFKQLEFKRYINHLPPHIKYVLLDESTELVFDLIDKLTDEMMERQKLFARLGVQRIDQVDTTTLEKPLPIIFVILDEFSIMSQSIAESQIYKLRLQNILAKGAALGIKFLFSSQTFTTGVAGLTPTARAQIQQRIAMKGTKEEISETLELSSNLKTDQVRNWMDALPPHYALVKFRISADTLPQVKRYLVMYFKDYSPRDQMIDQICASMQAVDSYDPANIRTYVDKHPVLVDGNSFDAFDEKEFTAYVSAVKAASGRDLSGDEIFISFGTPRLMERMKVAALSSETRENILMVARAAEQACAASILISAMKSYKLQNANVQIWAYDKNRLYRTYRHIFEEMGIDTVTGMDSICDEIRRLKSNIINGKTEDKLIVLVGMDRICVDFDYISNDPSTASSVPDYEAAMEKGRVKSEADQKKIDLINAFSKVWKPIELQLINEGKGQDEIKAAKREKKIQFLKENNYVRPHDEPNQVEKKEDTVVDQPKVGKAYNAKADFDFVVKQGSRLGQHFLLAINSYADLKTTGLKSEYFRYKMAFQVSVDDSRNLFNSRVGSTLPEHICQFDDTLDSYSFRPYLHAGVDWDGWYVESGKVRSPYEVQDY